LKTKNPVLFSKIAGMGITTQREIADYPEKTKSRISV